MRLIKGRGVSYVQASQDLCVHVSQLRDWVKKLSDDPQHAFPGHGQMKPEQAEIARLQREVTKLKAERDILKKAAAYFAISLRGQRQRMATCVCVSAVVYRDVGSKLDLKFEDLGAKKIKNIPGEIQVHRLRLETSRTSGESSFGYLRSNALIGDQPLSLLLLPSIGIDQFCDARLRLTKHDEVNSFDIVALCVSEEPVAVMIGRR